MTTPSEERRRDREEEILPCSLELTNLGISQDDDQGNSPVQSALGSKRDQIAQEMQGEMQTLKLQDAAADKLRREFRTDVLRDKAKQAAHMASTASMTRMYEAEADALARARGTAKLSTLLQAKDHNIIFDEFLTESQNLQKLRGTLDQCRLRIMACKTDMDHVIKRAGDNPTFTDVQSASSLLNCIHDAYRTMSRASEEYALGKFLAAKLQAAATHLQQLSKKAPAKAAPPESEDDDDDEESEAESE